MDFDWGVLVLVVMGIIDVVFGDLICGVVGFSFYLVGLIGFEVEWLVGMLVDFDVLVWDVVWYEM